MKITDLQGLLTTEDYSLAMSFIGEYRDPDEVISPVGEPYLLRWHVVPKNAQANVYFHILLGDDIGDMHTHPWHNMSVILSGKYIETVGAQVGDRYIPSGPYVRNKGETIYRQPQTPHRLELHPDSKYCMTLFSTGPAIKEWGFYVGHPLDSHWVHHTEMIENIDKTSRRRILSNYVL